MYDGNHSPANDPATMLANRIRKNMRRLKPWLGRNQIHAFRLYDRDIPEVPLSIDRYEDHLVIFRWKRNDDDRYDDAWLERALTGASEATGVPRDNIHVKTRERQRGASQYTRDDDAGVEVIVREGGLRFIVNLSDYLDTGLFLDLRRGRQLVREESRGRDVLNLFAYTGAFSVHAAAGGATSTTTVDLSNRYTSWARRNLELNGFTGPQHRLVRADVNAFLSRAIQANERWDLAIVDPPTFSNSAAMDEHFDVQAHHVDLLHAVRRVIRPGGAIWFSTNYRRFQLDEPALAPLRAVERNHSAPAPPA